MHQKVRRRSPNYAGSYPALVTQTTTNCNNPALNGKSTGLIGMVIRHTGLSMSLLSLDLISGGCTADGVYFQLGRVGRFQGNYTCSSGDYGSTDITEMNNLVAQFSGRIRRTSVLSGCISIGSIIGLIPN